MILRNRKWNLRRRNHSTAANTLNMPETQEYCRFEATFSHKISKLLAQKNLHLSSTISHYRRQFSNYLRNAATFCNPPYKYPLYADTYPRALCSVSTHLKQKSEYR